MIQEQENSSWGGSGRGREENWDSNQGDAVDDWQRQSDNMYTGDQQTNPGQ